MNVEARFRERALEVTGYIRSLQSLEQGHTRPGRGFYRAGAAIAASRAATFIMIYNCIEYGVRETICALRQDILLKEHPYGALHGYWQEEIARAHFFDRLNQGTNHHQLIRDIAKFAPGVVDWKSEVYQLPFSGNIDNAELLRFAARIESRWQPPRSTLGGSDLVLIRQMRNDLAHGKETFESVGSQFSTQDLADKFKRARKFMISLIRALEKYRIGQRYVRT